MSFIIAHGVRGLIMMMMMRQSTIAPRLRLMTTMMTTGRPSKEGSGLLLWLTFWLTPRGGCGGLWPSIFAALLTSVPDELAKKLGPGPGGGGR